MDKFITAKSKIGYANEMTRLISKAKFAELAGVTQSAIGKAVKVPLLKEALKGERIDFDHPDAVAYLKKQGFSTTEISKMEVSEKKYTRGTEAAKNTKKQESIEKLAEYSGDQGDVPENITDFTDYTLNEIIEKYGTDVAFCDWLKAVKMIEDIEEKRLKNAEKAGDLISRAIVENGLIPTVDAAFTRMLTDGAKTIAVRAKTLIETGAEVADVEELISKQLSTFIRPTKSKLERVLKNA